MLRIFLPFLFVLSFFPAAYAAIPTDSHANPIIAVRYDHDSPYEHIWHAGGVFINHEGYVLTTESIIGKDGMLVGCAASKNGEEAQDNCMYRFHLVATDKLNNLRLLQVSKVLVDEKWYTNAEYRKKFSDFPALSFSQCRNFSENTEGKWHTYHWIYTAEEEKNCYSSASGNNCYDIPFYETDAFFSHKSTETGRNGVDKFTNYNFKTKNGESYYNLGAILTDSQNSVIGFHTGKTIGSVGKFSNMEGVFSFFDTNKMVYEQSETDMCEEENTYEFPRDVTADEMKRDVTQSILHVESRYLNTNKVYAFGSGFFVGDDYHIITNNHVVDWSIEAEKINLRGCIQNKTNTQLDCPFVLKVVDIDEENDLALLKVKEVFNGNSVRKRTFAEYLRRSPDTISPLSFDSIRSVRKSDIITTYGFPNIDEGHWEKDKLPLQMTTGEIDLIWENIFRADARVVGGISGGPTFAEDNSLVGVVYAYPTQYPEKSLHITAEKLIAFLKKNKVISASSVQKSIPETTTSEKKETHILKKSFKSIIIEGVLTCNKTHTIKSMRKECVKKTIVDFIKEKNTEKRKLYKECRLENATDVPSCVEEKKERL